MTTSSNSQYLSVDQVAQRFNVSRDTIWRWKRQGEFPKPFKLGGTTTRWRLADIEEWESQLACGLITCLDVDADAMMAS